MSNSINTNVGAMVALSSLRATNSALSVASKQVQTGYRVADAQDDASTFSVAQGIRGNLQAFQAVQGSLSNGTGLGSVTQAALTSISNLVGNMQAKITQLSDGGINASQRAIYTADLNAMTSQVQNFINQANYNGTNLLTTASVSKTFLADTSGTTLTMNTQAAVNTTFTTFTGTLAGATDAATSAARLTDLAVFQSQVATSLGANAADTRSMKLQNDFVNAIVDATTAGLGAIVDADIGKASASVQSLQVRQQLGIQSMSIANQQPSVLLGLFR